MAAGEISDSSRQMGVARRRASSAWPSRSSTPRGCSRQASARPWASSASRRRASSAAPGSPVRRVGAVGVGHQHQAGPAGGAGGAEVVDVATRLDLQLDPAVALGHPGGDLGLDGVGGGQQPDRDAGGNRGGGAGRVGGEATGEGSAGGPPLGVEHGELEGGLRHRMADDAGEGRPHPVRRETGGLDGGGVEQPGHQVVAQHGQGALGVLGGVGRLGQRRALAPSLAVGSGQPAQHDGAGGDRAVGAGERRAQGEGDHPQLHLVDPHGCRAYGATGTRVHELVTARAGDGGRRRVVGSPHVRQPSRTGGRPSDARSSGSRGPPARRPPRHRRRARGDDGRRAPGDRRRLGGDPRRAGHRGGRTRPNGRRRRRGSCGPTAAW